MRSRSLTSDTRLRRTAMLLVATLIVAALYFGQGVLIPVALALLLTFVCTPLADWLERRGLPKAAAAILVVVVMCSLTLGLSYVVGDQLVRFAQDLPKYTDEINDKVRIFKGTGGGAVERFTQSFGKIGEEAAAGGTDGTTPSDAATQSTTAPAQNLTQTAGKQIADAGRSLQVVPASQPSQIGASEKNPLYVLDAGQTTPPLNNLTLLLGYIAGPLGTIGLVLVLVLFMLLEREQLRDRFIRLTSGGKYTLTTQALNDATTRVGRYLRALLIVNGTYGVAIATGLWIIGATLGRGVTFPSFILWGVLCAVLRFIPYVGPWVAAIFPLAVSLAVYDGFGVFIAVLSMFVIIELISNNIMEPILYGSSTGLSTVALLIAAIIWTSLWGPYGLLLSTPLTVCLVVLGKHVPQLKFLDVLLGDQPALPASARFYQRLLAGNRADAAEVAREVIDDRGPVAAADDVVLPAIRLARHDRGADELSSDEETALYAAVAQIIGELRDERRSADERDAKNDRDGDPSLTASPPAGPIVVGLPAHHRSEQIAVQMLAGLLAPAGVRFDPLACSLLPGDVEAHVEAHEPAAVFIAVLPPGGMVQARYLCRRLRRRFEHLPIVVGYYGRFRDYDALLVRLRAAGASYVTTSFAQSRAQLATVLGVALPPEPAAHAATKHADGGRRGDGAAAASPLDAPVTKRVMDAYDAGAAGIVPPGALCDPAAERSTR